MRARSGAERVTNVELFFDLVYVFAVTQISHYLLAHPTVTGALQAGLLLIMIWLVWADTTWVTNWLDPERIAVRLLLLGLAVAGANSAAPAATGTALKTTTTDGTTVLTNAQGFTLYSFAPDTPTSSKCYGSCAAYWPPVTGTAAGQGLPGKVTTITRTGGSHQLTHNGHPLYTYIGDTAPGQARGNNLDLNGGLWHEVPASR